MPALAPQVVFTRRATVAEVVEQLLVSYHDPTDWPGDHRCTKNILGYDLALGYNDERHECTHHHGGTAASLLDRLAELVPPSQSMARDSGGGKKSKGPSGSPAPWSAPAAELVDEIERGALALVGQARLLLGFGPLHIALTDEQARRRWVPASQVAIERAGSVALEALPGLLTAMRRRPELQHDLLVATKDRATGEYSRPGLIEQRLRGWHRAALVMTGHELKWAKLGQIANPHNPRMWPDETSGWLVGPTCEGITCRHTTCDILRRGRREKWVQPRCPHCDSASLRQDPLTGEVVCLRPSCVDAEGQRHTWSFEELQRLDVIIQTEAASA